MQALNVRERHMLFDTLGIFTPPAGSGITNPDGWYTTFATAGLANEWNFFNVRNRSAGLMWNNQDKRDQMATGMRVKSIGISFWGLPFTQIPTWQTDQTLSPEDKAVHTFVNDIPRHCGCVLQIQQDERLKAHPFFLSAGYGPYGDGYGRGAPSTDGALAQANGWDHHMDISSNGVPILRNRWEFPLPLEIPRTANLSFRVIPNEYARQLLQVMPFLPTYQGETGGDDMEIIPGFCGVQVSLLGDRLVQQRGNYFR